MAGHSKWANIKHKKAASDKKKGKVFSKLAKEIMVAVRESGPDPSANPRLRTALAAAKNANMPNVNIDRAVKKGSGDLDGANFEEIFYEGYGPEGIAVLAECLTDNRNRSSSEVRTAFDRNNGSMADAGAVTWMFHRKSRFVVTGENADEEKLMEIVIDAGAENIDVDEDVAEIVAPPEAFEDVTRALEEAGIEVSESGIIYHPENVVEISDLAVAQRIIRLVDALDDLDDVQAVHSNFEISDEIADQLEDE